MNDIMVYILNKIWGINRRFYHVTGYFNLVLFFFSDVSSQNTVWDVIEEVKNDVVPKDRHLVSIVSLLYPIRLYCFSDVYSNQMFSTPNKE